MEATKGWAFQGVINEPSEFDAFLHFARKANFFSLNTFVCFAFSAKEKYFNAMRAKFR